MSAIKKQMTVHYQCYAPLKDAAYQGGRPVPWIQMRGLWLREVGFEIGTAYTVNIKKRCLVLTAEGGQGHE